VFANILKRAQIDAIVTLYDNDNDIATAGNGTELKDIPVWN